MNARNFDTGEEFTKAVFNDFAKRYDCDMGDRQTAKGDVEFFLKQAKCVDGSILDIGCGDGRVAVPLIKSGKQVDGVDPAKKMLNKISVKLARREIAGNTFYCSDFMKWNNKKIYEMAFMAFNVFYHFDSLDAQKEVLKKCYSLLAPGGKLVIDVFRQKWEDLVKYHDGLWFDYVSPDGSMRYKKIVPDFDTQRNTINYFYFNQGEVDIQRVVLRYATHAEILLMLSLAGFKNVECFGDYKGTPVKYEHERMVFIAKK